MIVKCNLCFLFTLKRYFATDWIYYWNSGNFHQNAQNAHLNVFKLTSFQQAANQGTTSQQEHLKQMIRDLRFGLFFWWPGWVASKVLGFLLLEKKKPILPYTGNGWAWPPGSHSSTTRFGIQTCCRCRSGRSFLAQNVEVGNPNQPRVVEEGHARVHLPDRNQTQLSGSCKASYQILGRWSGQFTTTEKTTSWGDYSAEIGRHNLPRVMATILSNLFGGKEATTKRKLNPTGDQKMSQKHEKLLVFDTWNWCQPHKKTGNHLSWNQLLLYIPSSSQLFTVEPAAGTKSKSNKNNNDKMIIRRRILIKSRRRKRIEQKFVTYISVLKKKQLQKMTPFPFFLFVKGVELQRG